jgi:hypothetical protein
MVCSTTRGPAKPMSALRSAHLLRSRIVYLHRRPGDGARVARDMRERALHSRRREQRVDDWVRPIGRPIAPQPSRGGINRQNAIGKAKLEALDPRGQRLGGRRIDAPLGGDSFVVDRISRSLGESSVAR